MSSLLEQKNEDSKNTRIYCFTDRDPISQSRNMTVSDPKDFLFSHNLQFRVQTVHVRVRILGIKQTSDLDAF